MARRRRRARKRRVSPKTYTAMLRKLALYRRQGRVRAWERLKQSASATRRRMIAANRTHPVDGLPMPVFPKDLHQRMPPGFRRDYERAKRNRSGASVLKRHKRFWRVPYPPSIDHYDIGPKNKDIYLMGMGWTPEVHVSAARNPGAEKTVVKGRWKVACSPNGRQIVIFTGRQFKGPWKFVGYAPETDYIPTGELDRAGTPKGNTKWVHTHDDEGGVWPRVFADHGGKLTKATNFIYGTGTYSVTDWIRR